MGNCIRTITGETFDLCCIFFEIVPGKRKDLVAICLVICRGLFQFGDRVGIALMTEEKIAQLPMWRRVFGSKLHRVLELVLGTLRLSRLLISPAKVYASLIVMRGQSDSLLIHPDRRGTIFCQSGL